MRTDTFPPRLAVSRALAIVMLALTPALAASQPPAGGARPVTMAVPVPPSLVPTDGRGQLLYEVQVENIGTTAVTLESLDIRTDAPDVALRLDGDGLAGALDVPAAADRPRELPPGARRVIYVGLGARAERRGAPLPPTRIRHQLRVAAEGGAAVTVDDGDGVAPSPRAPVVLGPPLAGGPWVAVHHPDWPRGHRRVFYTIGGVTRLPGRHTIDFVRVDDDGRTSRGDRDLVAAALGYGDAVLAVTDATVAAVRDDMAEPARMSARVKHRQEDASGNYVSLDLGDGRFAVYEHLKPGSVTVAPGQRVRRGQVIAAVGVSGDVTAAHLHLHVGDSAVPLAAEGQPFVFDRFEVLGRYPDVAAMGKAPWQREGVGRREGERPGSNTVVDFGAMPR